MKNKDKTKEQLKKENNKLQKSISELKKLLSKQKQLEAELRTLSLCDDLTKLYNRRGFFTLAEHQFKLAKRYKRRILLMYADIDNLKQINDTFGHDAGGLAIIDTANILKSSLRDSDIIARFGGDEFVIFPLGITEESTKVIIDRLQEKFDAHNKKANRRYKLSISFGIKEYDSKSPSSLEDMIKQADKLMYEQKKSKKS
jgi:diguanylate cyclase (GGDEF)-like protein